ncbi:MAG: hypothetical protein HYR90_01120 [Candidatus Andersenbacteria bacterium]|nr:hypothetical protein [Candidatus Andersenbacteria bacterium]MBI3251149.1 hypothetical protein [Candidatus Andersenbacteria bacterium]
MLSFFRKKKKEEKPINAPIPAPVEGSSVSDSITWSSEATEALEQTLAQAPIPKLLKGKVRRDLKKAAEAAAQKSGRTQVSAHDLMQGFMNKLPAEMRNQVEQAARKGPEGLKLLQKKLQSKKK